MKKRISYILFDAARTALQNCELIFSIQQSCQIRRGPFSLAFVTSVLGIRHYCHELSYIGCDILLGYGDIVIRGNDGQTCRRQSYVTIFDRRRASADGTTLYCTFSYHTIASLTYRTHPYIHNQDNKREKEEERERMTGRGRER
jgi:hypothetical protein